MPPHQRVDSDHEHSSDLQTCHDQSKQAHCYASVTLVAFSFPITAGTLLRVLTIFHHNYLTCFPSHYAPPYTMLPLTNISLCFPSHWRPGARKHSTSSPPEPAARRSTPPGRGERETGGSPCFVFGGQSLSAKGFCACWD